MLDKICKNCGKVVIDNSINYCCCASISHSQEGTLKSLFAWYNKKTTYLSYIRYFFYVFLAIMGLLFFISEIFVRGEGLSDTRHEYFRFDYQYTIFSICSIVIVFFLIKSGLVPLSLPLAKYQENNEEFKKYKFGDYCFWSIVLFLLMLAIQWLAVYIWDKSNGNNDIFKNQFDYYFTPPSILITLYLPIILAVFRKLPFCVK